MGWIVDNIRWILILSGVLTCSMLVMAVAPRYANRVIFGEEISHASHGLVSRSWGAMIFASGLMLIYAAYYAEARLPILLYSIAGKLGFVVLVLSKPHFRKQRAFTMALGDLVIVALLAWYLISAG
ncbi:MAG: hypothetical protein HY243_16950 [Proteobacteria bacterium]|nr:hypothetical protein [Pseudomonadota bacterium]